MKLKTNVKVGQSDYFVTNQINLLKVFHTSAVMHSTKKAGLW